MTDENRDPMLPDSRELERQTARRVDIQEWIMQLDERTVRHLAGYLAAYAPEGAEAALRIFGGQA